MNTQRDWYTTTEISAPVEPMMAAQAAADMLGIHRSTLYLAVRKLKLIPDAYTPGGHARFRLETLERFRERLTLDSATGGDGSMSRAVASAIASLSRYTTLQPVCEAVVEAALTVCPGFETSIAVARDDDCAEHRELRLLAQRGLTDLLRREYRFLRRAPGPDFISAMVVRQQTRFVCGDVLAAGVNVPEGGLKVMTDAGFRACAVLPCVADGVALGVLICLGRTPCGFSEPEMVALGNLADVLTIALRRNRRDEATLRQSEAISALMRLAQLAHSSVPGLDDLGEVRRICQQGARARLVREWGIATAHEASAPPPLADLLRAAAATDATQRAEWIEAGSGRIALAIPAPVPVVGSAVGSVQASEGHAAVGAIWRRQDACSGLELALLHAYAQACAAIASR